MEEEEEDYERSSLFYKNLTTFKSEAKNMGFINTGEIKINSDFIIQNYISIPIYIDKHEKDNKIKIKTYI